MRWRSSPPGRIAAHDYRQSGVSCSSKVRTLRKIWLRDLLQAATANPDEVSVHAPADTRRNRDPKNPTPCFSSPPPTQCSPPAPVPAAESLERYVQTDEGTRSDRPTVSMRVQQAFAISAGVKLRVIVGSGQIQWTNGPPDLPRTLPLTFEKGMTFTQGKSKSTVVREFPFYTPAESKTFSFKTLRCAGYRRGPGRKLF